MENKKNIVVYDRKIVIAGDVVECVEYKRPIITGYKNKIEKQEREKTEEVKQENFNRSIKRTRKKIMDYVNCNFDKNSSFLTLTFKENMRDLELANYQWKLFKQRVNREFNIDLKYCGVIEFQNGDTEYIGTDGKKHKGTGRRAIHYHIVLFDVGFMKQEVLYKIWNEVTKGGVHISKIDNVDNVGAYIVGYMGKGDTDFFDNEYKGKKRYLASWSKLKKPMEIKLNSELGSELTQYNITVENLIKDDKLIYEYESDEIILKEEIKEVEYICEDTGFKKTKKELLLTTQLIKYKQFNLNTNNEFRNKIKSTKNNNVKIL